MDGLREQRSAMKRHGVPATITSTGRVSQSFVPGPAESLTGVHRWAEVYRRFCYTHPAVQGGETHGCGLASWRCSVWGTEARRSRWVTSG